MGVRNPRYEELLRLESKTLDAQFLTTVEQGLNCSPFESQAVLEVVKEVYFPFLAQAQTSVPLPGRITLVAVCADEPAGKPIAKCSKRTICLTLHRGGEDDRLLQKEGPDRFRQARIPDLCQEALSQGALLTREDRHDDADEFDQPEMRSHCYSSEALGYARFQILLANSFQPSARQRESAHHQYPGAPEARYVYRNFRNSAPTPEERHINGIICRSFFGAGDNCLPCSINITPSGAKSR